MQAAAANTARLWRCLRTRGREHASSSQSWSTCKSPGRRGASPGSKKPVRVSRVTFWSAGSRSKSKAVRTLVGPRLGSKKREAREASARATNQKKSQKRNYQPGGVEIPVATSK
eukprot:9230947-Pyramimonas_sp.AAC.1